MSLKAAQVGATAVALTAAATLAAVSAGRSRFDKRFVSELEGFILEIPESSGAFELEPRLAGLPAPVARFLRKTLGPNPVDRRFFRVKHGGEFRLKPDQEWMRMEAEEYFRVDRPGYLWRAKVEMAPLIYFDVRDFLWNGKGEVLAKVNSLVTVANAGGEATARGALIRWAAEVPWGSPQGFLDPRLFEWKPIDDRSASAVVRDPSGMTVTVTYRFTDEDLLDRMTTEDREMEEGGRFIKRPYSAVYSDYRQEQGTWIPYFAEATWHLPDGDFTYVRVRVDEMSFTKP